MIFSFSFALPLTIHGANRHSPVGWVITGKLWDVGCNFSCADFLAIFIDFFDHLTEVSELRNYKLVLESLGDKLKIWLNYPKVLSGHIIKIGDFQLFLKIALQFRYIDGSFT